MSNSIRFVQSFHDLPVNMFRVCVSAFIIRLTGQLTSQLPIQLSPFNSGSPWPAAMESVPRPEHFFITNVRSCPVWRQFSDLRNGWLIWKSSLGYGDFYLVSARLSLDRHYRFTYYFQSSFRAVFFSNSLCFIIIIFNDLLNFGTILYLFNSLIV